MKRVLITGANSYVGTNVEKWLMKEPDKYYVETLDMKDPNWKNFDFSNFDVVFHVAGIAHVSTKKSMKDLYFKVNRDLTIETAVKAKSSGVKQFIFMSSMIVYNSKEKCITSETATKPDNFYGLSKLQAEEGILPLQSNQFDVCILRPPMIYGPGSKGNFLRLSKIAKWLFIFPSHNNIRSALFIGNLTRYIDYYISFNKAGLYFPQNKEYFSTSDIILTIRKIKKKKTYITSIFNTLLAFLIKRLSIANKIFGDFYYLQQDNANICEISLKDSLFITFGDEKYGK